MWTKINLCDGSQGRLLVNCCRVAGCLDKNLIACGEIRCVCINFIVVEGFNVRLMVISVNGVISMGDTGKLIELCIAYWG